MGNQTTAASIASLQVCQPSPAGEWQKEGTTGYCDLVRNRRTGQLAEQYMFQRDQRLGVVEDCRRYEFRRQQRSNIVEVYQVECDTPQQYICLGDEVIRVRTERIVRRLADRGKDISQQEAVAILQQALIGYSAIATNYGPSKINDEMIGWTPKGIVKVWLNENFSRNSPDVDSEVFASRRKSTEVGSKQAMLDGLLESIDSHVQPPGLTTDFKAGFAQKAATGSFEQVTSFVGRYAEGHRNLSHSARESATIIQQLVPSEAMTISRQAVAQPTSILATSVPDMSRLTMGSSYTPKQSLEIQQPQVRTLVGGEVVPATSFVQHMQQQVSPLSRTRTSPIKMGPRSVAATQNLMAVPTPHTGQPIPRHFSLGRSHANLNHTSRHFSLSGAESRLVSGNLLKSVHQPPLAASSQNNVSQLRIVNQVKPHTSLNNTSQLRLNLSVGRLPSTTTATTIPQLPKAASRLFVAESANNLNKSLNIPNRLENSTSVLNFGGAVQPVGSKSTANCAAPISFTYNMFKAPRKGQATQQRGMAPPRSQPSQSPIQSQPQQQVNFSGFRQQSPPFEAPKAAQMVEGPFRRTKEVVRVTPDTLFEPRPPTAQRNQIKIVYEDQQLDAYTLENLTNQQVVLEQQLPYQQPKAIIKEEEPTVNTLKPIPLKEITVQEYQRQQVQQQIQQVQQVQQQVQQVQQPVVPQQPQQRVYQSSEPAPVQASKPYATEVIASVEVSSEQRPIVLKQSLPNITFSIGRSIEQQSSKEQIEVKQPQRTAQPVEQMPQQPAILTVNNNTNSGGLRYEQLSSEYQQQYLSELQEYKRRQDQAAQEQLIRQQEQAAIQAKQAEIQHQARIREQQARAEAQAQAQAHAQAQARAQAQAKAQADLQAQANARLQAEAEARSRAEAAAKASSNARLHAEAIARAEAEAQAQTRAEIEAIAQAARIAVETHTTPKLPQTISQQPLIIENITQSMKSQESPPKRIFTQPLFIPAVSPARVIVQPTIYERLSEDSITESGQRSRQSNPAPATISQDVEIIEQDGRQVGYEVVETDVYYTPEGDRITVEEDYQVIYDQQGKPRVIDTDSQFPISDKSIPAQGSVRLPTFGGQATINVPVVQQTRISQSPTAVHYAYNTSYQTQEQLDPVSPIIHLARYQSVAKNSDGSVHEPTKFSLNPSVVQQEYNGRQPEYASSLKYSSGVMTSGVASDGFFSHLREDVGEDASSGMSDSGIPTYEGLRAQLVDSYSNVHRSNPLYSARIEAVDSIETEEQYPQTIPLPPTNTR